MPDAETDFHHAEINLRRAETVSTVAEIVPRRAEMNLCHAEINLRYAEIVFHRAEMTLRRVFFGLCRELIE
ncbi:MAG TPA: hypothetical protein VGD05_03665 [Pyrinomonadaceae bacterium]